MRFDEVLRKGFAPTAEDLAKQLTNDQLVKLCLRNRCRVDMWRWNVVDEFKLNFLDDGRFEGKSEKFKKKLLLKACNRYKERFIEREKDLLQEKQEEWAFRKKYSLLQLDLWEYDEAREREDQTLMENGMNQQEFMHPLELNLNRNKTRIENSIEKNANCNTNQSKTNVNSLYRGGKSHEKQPVIQSSQHSDGENSLPQHLNIINSESLTLENLTEEISTELSVTNIQYSPEDFPITLSQLDEQPVQQICFQHLQSLSQSPVLLATQSQSYDEFHERLPISSTQDSSC